MYRKDLNFIENKTKYYEELNPVKNKENSKKKKLFFLLAIFIFLLISIFIVRATKNNDLSNLEYDPITLEPKEPEGFFKKISYLIFNKNTKLAGAKKDRINILLLGQGGLGHDGPYLTDTIMLLSYSPSKNEIAMVSIPRDLGVNIANYGLNKINHANHFGEMEKTNNGAALATKTISETFNIEIPYYLRIDFKAFTEIIDEVGGIRVEVENSFTDYEYPTDNYQYQTISFEKGVQTMDGDTALKFARSRHGNSGEGSDFARAKRQQKIILALKDKVLSFSTLTNPIKIKKILSTLESNMISNMNFDEILEFIKIAKNLNNFNTHNLILDDSPQGFLTSGIAENGAFLLLAKEGNWDRVSQAIQNIFETEATTHNLDILDNQTTTNQTETAEDLSKITKENILIEIQNGTWQTGLAAQLKQKLLDQKYYVETIGNTDPEIKPISSTAIYKINENVSQTVIDDMAKTLGIKTGQNPINSVISTATNTDVLIIVGNDYLN